MFARIIRAALTAAIIATTAFTGFAKETSSFPYREIEIWRDQGVTFVVRDAAGHIVHHAQGNLERWRNGKMVWVVRDSEGKFLTRAEGRIEAWGDGTRRLVLRNRAGKFVAMATVATTDRGTLDLPAAEVASEVLSLE